MSAHAVHTIRFTTPPTVAEMLEALEDLRAQVGPAAVVRVTGVIEFNLNGTRVAAVCAERAVRSRAPKDAGRQGSAP